MPVNCPASSPHLLSPCGKHSAPRRTPFRCTAKSVRLPTGMAFVFRPECCSDSQRNGVRLQTGIAFAFDRIPHYTTTGTSQGVTTGYSGTNDDTGAFMTGSCFSPESSDSGAGNPVNDDSWAWTFTKTSFSWQ